MPFIARSWLLFLLPAGYLWLTLINQLRPEWSTNPQYSYGWIVPLLCIGLLWHSHQTQTSAGFGPSDSELTLRHVNATAIGNAINPPLSPRLAFWSLVLGGILFFPIRMLQSADPTWRLIHWLLAFDVIGLTLGGVCLVGGITALRRYAFPICFFLVAVPWPYPIEKWLIQHLTFSVSAATVEVLGMFGFPSVMHGRMIEVGSGIVGIDEACSGIRSFQSSLMISLFLGALYDLPFRRRTLLVPIGFATAFLFNVCRTAFLAWIAAKKGLGAVAANHDQAGLSILLACTLSLWMLALLMRARKAEIRGAQGRTDTPAYGVSPHPAVCHAKVPIILLSRRFAILLILLTLWFLFVEIGVALWIRAGTSTSEQVVHWSIALPADNPAFQKIESNEDALTLLHYDNALQVKWTETNGITCHLYYFDWLPGKVGAYLAANRHSPEICMTYTGWELRSGPSPDLVQVNNLHLPFRRYSFVQSGNVLHVFHCRWEPSFEMDPSLLQSEAGVTLRPLNGLSVLWSGKGKGGQKVLELVIQGCASVDDARAVLVQQLKNLIKVAPPETKQP
jgi:exosortase